jgi:hypothetical protein
MKRLIEMCKAIWPMLTEEEQEAIVYDAGVYGFIEDIAGIIHFDVNELTADDMDKICDEF